MFDKKKNFIESATNAVASELQEKAPAAARFIAEHFGTTEQDRREVPALAALLSNTASENPIEKVFLLPGSPDDEASSEILAEWATPWAEQLRQELFGSPQPPFDSIDEAIKWIKHDEASPPFTPHQEEEMDTWHRRIRKQVDDWEAEGNPIIVGLSFPRTYLIPYPGDDKGWHYVRASSNQKLLRLAKETEEMKNDIGWQQGQAVMFVLTGLVPYVSRIMVASRIISVNGQHGQDVLVRQWAEVKIRGNNVTINDLKQLFELLRDRGIVKKKPLREKDMRVKRFVKDCKKQGKHWKQIRTEWNQRYPKETYDSIRGMQKVVLRVERKQSYR